MLALDIQNVSKKYKQGPQALSDISFQVEDGDFFALLGPNGAGKSTLINILTHLTQKTSGTIKVYGHDLDRELNAAKACIGVVPQEFNFNWHDLTLEVVVNQAGYYGIPMKQAKPLAEYYLEQLGLKDKLKKPLISLSGGMKRRVMIARALAHQPKLLILDEPTAGVDIELRRSLWDFLKTINKQGVTIILTTHYLEEAENLCRNIAIINHGKILENTQMATLLQSLNKETFIFYTKNPLPEQPDFPHSWSATIIDSHAFEITLVQPAHLNKVFAQLERVGVEISSMRNKTNRLEALFLDRVYQDEGEFTA